MHRYIIFLLSSIVLSLACFAYALQSHTWIWTPTATTIPEGVHYQTSHSFVVDGAKHRLTVYANDLGERRIDDIVTIGADPPVTYTSYLLAEEDTNRPVLYLFCKNVWFVECLSFDSPKRRALLESFTAHTAR